ncbi:autophagy-related protein 16 isoform X1 [Asparagus officinalis]|nr:autophagy-related protein 16 isoform X1 [Asparagus officinalis]
MIARSFDEIGSRAINLAIRALRKRRLVEEGAHAPAIDALSRPWAVQGLEWKEKAEKIELELQQCYKAQSRLSEQLVVEVAECRSAKFLAQEKEALITALQSDLAQTREENCQLKESLDEKTKGLDLCISENHSLRAQLAEVQLKLKNAEADNKNLIDRWMLEKMKDAEKLNEANSMYEDMMQRLKVSSIEQLARQQVDGVVRQREAGYYDNFSESSLPSTLKHTITQAHAGGCGSLKFEPTSHKLITGGQDRLVNIWDSNTGTLTSTLHGCLGSILDLAITHDNKSVIAASSSNQLIVWDSGSGRIRHTLTGHQNKVCAVDASKASSRSIVSASSDHTIKVWDLHKGFCINTIISASNCNAVCYSIDGVTIFSAHVDGNLRLWDSRTGQLITEVAAHSQAVTSVNISRSGNFVLTSGRDNLHNLFDVRSLEVCGTFRASGNRVASNWSRSCISPDENYVAAGSADGAVYVWTRAKEDASVLEGGHSSHVLSCAWDGLSNLLASADKNGNICIWT